MPFYNAKLYTRKRGRPRKGYSKTGKKLGRPSSKPTVSQVKRIVKKVISRQAENKTIQWFTTGIDIWNINNANFLPSIFPVSPYLGFLNVEQGVGQGERVGNRIRIKRIWIKGTIYPQPYNSTINPNPQPVQVILWFFCSRSSPNLLPNTMSGFLQDGDSARNLQGDLTDVISLVNNDQFRLFHKRVFKIGYAAYEGTGIQPAQQAFHNNDFKLNRTFKVNLKKHVVKNVVYNDTGTNVPRTRGLFCVAQAVNADGSIMANNITPAQMSFQLSMEYEDY